MARTKQEKSESEKSKFEEAIEKLNKQYGAGTILTLDGNTPGNYETISSGSIGMDYITLGVGGFVKGKLYELMGWEGVGKSTICGLLASHCQENGGKVLYIDSEHAVDKAYFRKLGIDTSKLLISQPSCIWEDEYILTNNGYIKFKDIDSESLLISTDKNLIFTKDNPLSNLLTSQKEGILLRTGKFNIILSKEHKIKTFKGFKKVEDIDPKIDKIETLYKHSLYSKENLTDLNPNKAFILGAFIGDGNYNRSSPRLYGADEELINYLLHIINIEFPDTTSYKKGITITFSKKDRTKGKWDNCSLQKFLNDYLGKVAKQEKYIPKEIFNSGIENLKYFIAGLIMTDGSINPVRNCISFSNYIKNVTLDISSIFSFFSIPHSIRTKTKTTKTGVKTWYEIVINTKEGIEFFKNEIPLLSYKKNKLEEIDLVHKKSFIRFPKEVWELIFSETRKKYKTITAFSNEFFNTNRNKHLFNTKRGISNDYLIKLNSFINSDEIKKLIESDVSYCNIIELKNTHKQYSMRDITINSHHNFITNGMIVHNCGEEGFNVAIEMIESGEIDLVIIDSDNGLIPKKVIDGEVGDSAIGRKAMLNSNAIPKLKKVLALNKVCVIITSQYREKIGMMFGDPKTTQGGHALKYYSDCRMELTKTLIKDGIQPIGFIAKIKTTKNKMDSPFRTTQFNVYFKRGLAIDEELLELGNTFGVLRKYGKSITYNDVKYEADEFNILLKDNPDFFNEIKDKIVEKIKNEDLPESLIVDSEEM